MNIKCWMYPVTIVEDRYNGVYSGGKWIAWHCYPWSIPQDIFEDDTSCGEYWGQKRKYPLHGVGDTIDDALENLRKEIEQSKKEGSYLC